MFKLSTLKIPEKGNVQYTTLTLKLSKRLFCFHFSIDFVVIGTECLHIRRYRFCDGRSLGLVLSPIGSPTCITLGSSSACSQPTSTVPCSTRWLARASHAATPTFPWRRRVMSSSQSLLLLIPLLNFLSNLDLPLDWSPDRYFEISCKADTKFNAHPTINLANLFRPLSTVILLWHCSPYSTSPSPNILNYILPNRCFLAIK